MINFGKVNSGVSLNFNTTLQSSAFETQKTFEFVRSNLRNDINKSLKLDSAAKGTLSIFKSNISKL